MKSLLRFAQVAVVLGLLAGCANFPSLLTTPQPATVTPDAAASATPTTAPGAQVTPESARILRVWVPPQYDPAAESQVGELLQARLDAFALLHPNLQIVVRVKAESGPGNMLEALAATNAAAPALMPDLVALSRAEMESATLKGLLHPMDEFTELMDDPDWYPYARQMARIQNTVFGIPFASNALVLTGTSESLPATWLDLQEGQSFLFAAADPQALFSLGLYLSQGGSLVDENSRPFLDEAILTEVLEFFARSVESGFLSPTVNNYQSNAQAWQAFQEQRANMGVVWVSDAIDQGMILAPLPGLDSGYFSLSTGWVWSLADSNPENQPLAVELAEFLSESGFLADYAQAAGILPTRPAAFSSWQDAETRSVLEVVSESAQLVPPKDLLVSIGPLFQEAVNSVLIQEKSPSDAARIAGEQLK